MIRISRATAVILCLTLCVAGVLTLSGCEKTDDKGYKKNGALNTNENVELVIACSRDTWPEMDTVISKFEEVYPNCSVIYEYIEEYTANLTVRLGQPEHKIDIFRTVNIQESTPYKDYALNLISDESKKYLDLSGTNAGLVDNFRYTSAENTQYAIPYGGEMRGMYVNKTLLSKFGLKVPTNRTEFMKCCEVLYQNGYIPFQSASGTFAQQFLYPYICNSIVNGGNYEKMYSDIENITPGVSEYFREAYAFLYEIVEKGYYDYKRVDKELGYMFDGSAGKAREFLNVKTVSPDVYEKQDDVGKIAFMVDTQAFELYLSKAKNDFHSAIEYEFILSPVGKDGGCAYLSPADGLAVNNRSNHIDWALEFLNFFFQPEISKAFAEQTGKIPNTTDALLRFDVPSDRTCDVGQVTFSYPFYKTVTTLMLGGYEDDMIGISKMNDTDYMKQNADGSYSLMYTLDDYIARLEAEFQKIRESRNTEKGA